MTRILPAILILMFAAAVFAAEDDVAGFDDRRGASLPDVAFVDDSGTSTRMSTYFERPFYLAFAYHTCPQLCGLVLGRFATALRDVPGRIGDAFDVVVVSIDPNDNPQRSQEARHRYATLYGSDGRGWHFLTGSEQAIRTLAQAAGFRFVFDPIRGTFVHPAGVFYIDRGGVVRGHVEGADFSGAQLMAARDADAAPSAWNRLCGALGIGDGVHSASVIATLRTAVVVMLLAIATFVAWRVRKSGIGQ